VIFTDCISDYKDRRSGPHHGGIGRLNRIDKSVLTPRIGPQTGLSRFPSRLPRLERRVQPFNAKGEASRVPLGLVLRIEERGEHSIDFPFDLQVGKLIRYALKRWSH